MIWITSVVQKHPHLGEGGGEYAPYSEKEHHTSDDNDHNNTTIKVEFYERLRMYKMWVSEAPFGI